MTLDAYTALSNCASRRIESEWLCTDAERAVLSLINELSFALGQSLAIVPSLSDFAAATGFHKSTISRAIRSALKKDYLMILKRRDEILYGICTETEGTVATTTGDNKEEAKKRLVELNQNRLQGKADANGQQRLPGVLENEEVEAPTRAFAAMMHEISDEPSPVRDLGGTERTAGVATAQRPGPENRPRLGSSNVSATDVETRLSRLTERMEEAREQRHPSPLFEPTPRTTSSYEKQWNEASRGLQGDSLYALELIRDECVIAGPKQEAAFYQFRFAWRKRVQERPRLAAESAGVCKAMRNEGNPPKEPGGFIYRTMQAASQVTSS